MSHPDGAEVSGPETEAGRRLLARWAPDRWEDDGAEVSGMETVEYDDETYVIVDGHRVGPVIDGHVFASIDPDARCTSCCRSALDHSPKAFRDLMERVIVPTEPM